MCNKPEWAKIQTGRNAALDPIHTANELNSMPDLETVVLSGGDPMNYKHLQEYLNAIREDISFGMFTTGLDNHTNRYSDLPLERFGYIRFSIDGNTPETWAKIRGSSERAYDIAWNNVIAVAGKFKQIFGNLLGKEKIRVQYTIQSENIREFPDMVDKCFRHDIPIYGYWVHDYNVVSEEQVKELRFILNTMITRPGIGKWCQQWTNVYDIVETGDSVPIILDASKCVIPLVHAFIDTDGSVFTCCYLVGDNLPFDKRDLSLSYGNIYEKHLQEILSKESIEKISVSRINNDNPICKSCISAKSRYYKVNLEAHNMRYRRPTFL